MISSALLNAFSLHEEKEQEDPPVHEHRPQMKPDPEREQIDDQIHETPRMTALQALLLVEPRSPPPAFLRRVPLRACPEGFRYHSSASHVHSPITKALSAYTSVSVESSQCV